MFRLRAWRVRTRRPSARCEPCLCAPEPPARVGGLRRLIEGLQRFLIARLVVEQRGELQLKIGVGIGGATNGQRASDEQRECERARERATTVRPGNRRNVRMVPPLPGTWAPQPTPLLTPLCRRYVLKELRVHRNEVLPLLRRLVEGKDRLHRTSRHAGTAVDALVGVNI